MASNTSISDSTYNQLLRNYYSVNRNACKEITRSSLKTEDLIRADSSALRKVARNLNEMEYSAENGISIFNNIKAFVDSYNNLKDSSSKSDSIPLSRAQKNLTNFIKANKEELAELGLTVSGSGKLRLDKDALVDSNAKKIGKLFSSSGDFSKSVLSYATKILRVARNLRSPKVTAAQNVPAADVLPVTPSTMTANAIDFKA